MTATLDDNFTLPPVTDADTDDILDGEEKSAAAASGGRLDKVISESFDGISRAAAAKYIDEGRVFVDGVVCTSKSVKVGERAKLTVTVPFPTECRAVPENIPIDIVYEDGDILIVNKPKGMVVHPAPGNYTGTLVNALLYHCCDGLSGINGVIRPGIVHRIDKDTSGILVVAKNDRSHTVLSDMIKRHNFKRIYKTLLIGTPKEPCGTVNAHIGRNPADRKKMAVVSASYPGAREAITHYRVIESFRGFSFCEMKLETGRTHQIRVHMAHIGHPVVADPLYSPKDGKNRFGESGQFLHAEVLGFKHPVSGEYMEFSAPLPEYFEKALAVLRSESER